MKKGKIKQIISEDSAFLLKQLGVDCEDRKQFEQSERLVSRLEMKQNYVDAENKKLQHDRLMESIKVQKYKQKKRNIYLFTKIAALIILFAGIGYFFYDENIADQQNFIVADINIDSISETRLIMPEGKKITVSKNEEVLVENSTNTIQIRNTKKYVTKEINLKRKAEPEYITAVVPKGKIQKINLPDGSTVWINSAGTLSFPSVMNSGKRVVHLNGEAYFDVKHDKSSPFIVKTNGMDIRVLGTSFNVKAYMEDNQYATTLVEGEVELQEVKSGKTFIMKPGNHVTYDIKKRVMNVRNVDTDYYTIWRNGLFMFEYEELSHILKRIERTYDIDIKLLATSLRSHKISGKIERKNSPIRTLGSICDLLKLKIEYRDRTYYLKEKNR